MPRAKKAKGPRSVETFVHAEEQRRNIPTAELETFMKDEDRAPKRVTYPRPTDVLYPRDPAGDPQLVWRGKDEQDRQPLEALAPPIYIQEKIHPKAIIEDLRRQDRGEAPAQADLFADFNGIEFEDLVEFYQHEQHWSNRMILGDSLEVMTSLAEREGLKGKVQCIYVDPPYGVNFRSNWQIATNSRDVKDGKSDSVTRQPEQVRAFRDTWSQGIHSYLSYLRDRLILCRALLAQSGSIFVQIGDTNVHLVRSLLDEVVGGGNFVAEIAFTKGGGALATEHRLSGNFDLILWYARDVRELKYRPLFEERSDPVSAGFTLFDDPSEGLRPLTKAERLDPSRLDPKRLAKSEDLTKPGPGSKYTVKVDGRSYEPGARWWGMPQAALERLVSVGRVRALGRTLRAVRYAADFPLSPMGNLWTGVGGSSGLYVVETNPTIVQRCILMSSDPGDIVVDPTCGSGTTAYVAEQWGRRWITIDTSRVALALARQRLITARYPKYQLASADNRDLRAGFVYHTVPHVTLTSIAYNADVREGMSSEEVERAVTRATEKETLYDDPVVEPGVVRVTGPFTVESLSAPLGVPSGDDGASTGESSFSEAEDFRAAILANLAASGVQNTVRDERLTFTQLDGWPGQHIHAVGQYLEDGKVRRAAVTIGPQYGTVDADAVRAAAKEAAGFFDILIVCGFAFDAYIANEFKLLGNLTVLKVNMNPDLSMGGDLLKKTGTGNLFTVFGEPDVDVRSDCGRLVVEIRGVDIYDPTTGQIRPHSTEGIACWFIDTAYDGSSFFVRHVYFAGPSDAYKSLKDALKADIQEAAWASLHSTVSRPFDVPQSGRIAVKVINHYGDEVMKVYDTAAVVASDRDTLRYRAAEPPALLAADDVE
jgi:adenine-specific DNA-methyltransferase